MNILDFITIEKDIGENKIYLSDKNISDLNNYIKKHNFEFYEFFIKNNYKFHISINDKPNKDTYYFRNICYNKINIVAKKFENDYEINLTRLHEFQFNYLNDSVEYSVFKELNILKNSLLILHNQVYSNYFYNKCFKNLIILLEQPITNPNTFEIQYYIEITIAEYYKLRIISDPVEKAMVLLKS